MFTYPLHDPVEFEWDKGNTQKNWEKHSITPQQIEEALLSRPIVLPDINHSLQEVRYYAFGETAHGDKLTIVFTVRNKKIRPISARKQNKKERDFYAQAKT